MLAAMKAMRLVAVTVLCTIGLASAATQNIAWAVGMASNTMTAATGDNLVFSWSGSHNVYLMASETAYTGCSFTGATLLSSSSPTTYTIPAGAGPFYFACSVGSHCSAGQKIAVSIPAPTPTPPAPTPPAPPSYSPSPTPPPTPTTRSTTVTFSHISAAQYCSITQAAYEKGFGRNINIIDTSTNIYITGNSVSSTASRRSMAVLFVATLAPAQAASASSAVVTASSLASNIAAAAAAAGTTAVANVPTQDAIVIGSSSDDDNTGVIVGAVVGGVAGLAIIVGLVYYFVCASPRTKEPPKSSTGQLGLPVQSIMKPIESGGRVCC